MSSRIRILLHSDDFRIYKDDYFLIGRLRRVLRREAGFEMLWYLTQVERAGVASDFHLAPSERKTRLTGLTGLEVLKRRLQIQSAAFYLRPDSRN